MNQDKKQKQTDIYNHIFSDNQDIYLIEWLEKSRQDLHEKSIDLYIKHFNDVNSKSQIERVKHNFKARIKKVLSDLIEQITIARVQRTKDSLFSEFIAKPEDLHGNTFISNELEKDSKITAKVISGATWINAITNWPILYYAFQNWGTLIALSSATTLNFLILTWTNNAGTAAAGGNKGKLLWSLTGIISFFMISMLQSMVAGVGAELINNQRELSELKAQEIVDNYLSQLGGNLDDIKARYQENIDLCKEKTEELLEMDYWNPRRNSLWLETYGPYGAEDPDKICPTATRQQNEIDTREESLEELKNERQELGNLVFAQNNLESRYSQYFDENGKILSGVIAVEFAINNFWGKFTTQEFEKLGFPLFFLLLSIITSFGALLMTLTYAIKYTTKMSRSSKVEQSVNLWLNEVWYSYIARENELNFQDAHNQDAHNTDPSLETDLKQKKYRGFLLSLFIQEIQKTGRLGYPALEQIAQAANHHPDYVFQLVQCRQLIDKINKSSSEITEASTAINNRILNLILSNKQPINKDLLVEYFNIDQDFQKLSYAIHNLLNINHKSIENSYSVIDIFNIAASFFNINTPGSNNVYKNYVEENITKIWKELNQQCNLSWILWGDFASNSSQCEADDRKKRCLEVGQKLSQLSGYCHKFSVIVSNKLKDKVDKARLIPVKTNSPPPTKVLPDNQS